MTCTGERARRSRAQARIRQAETSLTRRRWLLWCEDPLLRARLSSWVHAHRLPASRPPPGGAMPGGPPPPSPSPPPPRTPLPHTAPALRPAGSGAIDPVSQRDGAEGVCPHSPGTRGWPTGRRGAERRAGGRRLRASAREGAVGAACTSGRSSDPEPAGRRVKRTEDPAVCAPGQGTGDGAEAPRPSGASTGGRSAAGTRRGAPPRGPRGHAVP